MHQALLMGAGLRAKCAMPVISPKPSQRLSEQGLTVHVTDR